MERRPPLWLLAAVLAAAPAFAENPPGGLDAPEDIADAKEIPCAPAKDPDFVDPGGDPTESPKPAPERPPCPTDDLSDPAKPPAARPGAQAPASPKEEVARAEASRRAGAKAQGVAQRGAAILKGMDRQAGAAIAPGAGAAPSPASPGADRRPDLRTMNRTPASQSAYNTLRTGTVPLAATPAAQSAAVAAKAKADEAHKAWAESYFEDPRMQKAVRQVMEKAEAMVGDPKYTNSTYGWVYKLAPRRAKVAMAANDVMMGYRYGGSEAQFSKDFGGDLKAGEVADLDHFFAGGVYGAIPVLGPMVCAGLSVAYDGVVSPAQKKFKNYSYDLKQVGTDMKGCSYALTMEGPGRAF